jgi:glutamyl-tRNA reductase
MAQGHWFLVTAGISHKTASLERRAPLQIGHEEMARANALLSDLPLVKESLVLSTCNRVELYMVLDGHGDAFEVAADLFRQLKGVDISDLQAEFYIKKNRHAAAHLFRVTAGLDSMVLGENQIVQQVRDAYSSACAVKSAGKLLHRLFHQAFRIGKEVRTDTEMGKGACSVSTAAIDLLTTRVAESSNPTVLFVGVNQMIALAARNLSARRHCRFVFANRTVEKAADLAAKYTAESCGLDELAAHLPKADVVIACTGAPGFVIGREDIAAALGERDNRPLVLVDMAIPRDIEFDSNDHALVEVHDLEAIKSFVREQQQRREAAIPEAEAIIDRKLSEFIYWYEHVRYEPMYNGLHESFEHIREQELEILRRKLPEQLREEFDLATKHLIKHLLDVTVRTTQHPKHGEHSS